MSSARSLTAASRFAPALLLAWLASCATSVPAPGGWTEDASPPERADAAPPSEVDSGFQPPGGADAGPDTPPADGSVTPPEGSTIDCEVLVVGGGTGGVAAALAAARAGADVCLTEETDWLGGQFTAQGLNASDENEHIEEVGSTRSFQELRALIREPFGGLANPGRCWVSYLCAPPTAALDAIASLLEPYRDGGNLRVFPGVIPSAVTTSGDRVTAVELRRQDDGSTFTARAAQTIDATELGDVIKLSGAAYRTGQEPRADTGEPDAPVAGCPECVQAFTYVTILEKRPAGENHRIPRPDGFGERPWMSGFSHGRFAMFSDYGVWRYRRVADSAQLGGTDLSLMNWSDGNDYYFGNIIDKSPDEVALHLARARERTLAYVYWLQNEADGVGYPNLKLRADLLGTTTGVAKTPYIRESRRLRALETIKVTDVSDAYVSGSRARHFQNAAAIGFYHLIDLHRSAAAGSGNPSGRGLPFQVPLGALIPERTDGLIAGAKNIGSTHLSNGALRMHPTEWAIGEAAGTLAAACAGAGLEPRDVFADEARLRAYQLLLLDGGAPLYFATDVPPDDRDWKAIQLVATAGIMAGPESNTLAWRPDATTNRAQAAASLVAALDLPMIDPATPRFSDVPRTYWAYRAIETLAAAGIVSGTGGGQFSPLSSVTHAHLRIMIARALGDALAYTAVPASAADSAPMPNRAVARALFVVLADRLALP